MPEYDIDDTLKNDFQNATKRNLQRWTMWRIRLNEKLVESVLNGEQLEKIEPIHRYLNHRVPVPDHPTTNPKTLMSFSAAHNTATNLSRPYFYKYGIPRAKLDPSKQQTIIKSKLKNGPSVDNFDNDSKLTEDSIVLDYFYSGESSRRSLPKKSKY